MAELTPHPTDVLLAPKVSVNNQYTISSEQFQDKDNLRHVEVPTSTMEQLPLCQQQKLPLSKVQSQMVCFHVERESGSHKWL